MPGMADTLPLGRCRFRASEEARAEAVHASAERQAALERGAAMRPWTRLLRFVEMRLRLAVDRVVSVGQLYLTCLSFMRTLG